LLEDEKGWYKIFDETKVLVLMIRFP